MGVDGGEIGRHRRACHIGTSASVNSHRQAGVGVATAEIGGVDDFRIYDERPSVIVGSKRELNPLIGCQGVLRCHSLSIRSPLLPCLRLAKVQFMAAGGHNEAAVAVFPHLIRAVEPETDVPRIRSCRDFKIEFNVVVFQVIDQVNTGIYRLVFHMPVMRDSGQPAGGIVADAIIGFRSQHIAAQ